MDTKQNLRGKLILIAAILFIFSLFSYLIDLYFKYLWFNSIDYSSVFLTRISYFWSFFAIGLITSTLLFFTMLSLANKKWKWYWLSALARKRFFALIALLEGVILASSIAASWEKILLYFNSTSFNISDPVFNKDISFYIFGLPVFDFILSLIGLIFFFTLVNILGTYLFSIWGITSELEAWKKEEIKQNFKGLFKTRLIAGFIAFFFIILGVTIFRNNWNLVFSQNISNSVFGPSAADVTAQIPGNIFFAVFSILIGLIIFFLKRTRPKFILVGVWFVAFILATSIWPSLYQRFAIVPDEIAKEKPYIERNIKFTRQAFSLENIEEEDYPAKENISFEKVQNHKDYIRINDWRALKDTYAQQQEIRPLYKFQNVDIDRYKIDGKLMQVMLSAREISYKDVPDSAKNFNNLTFKYTHGYGSVMSPTNKVTPTGLPEYLIKDIPPVSETIKISEPRIYFGELDYLDVIVNTKIAEFDYPQGESNKTYFYEGKNGIPMTTLNRILWAYKQKSLRYLLADAITAESQLLVKRNIMDRINSITDFLLYDQDPYLVIGDNGRQYYIVDAYTTADKYPYSPQIGTGGKTFNYIRNSVKVVIDAYSGKVNYYVFDKEPVIESYMKLYPDLFKTKEQFPEYLADHIRYPEYMLQIQASILTDYHMKNPEVFFNREDRWQIPNELYYGNTQQVAPYYSLTRLPGNSEPEYLLLMPFSPIKKQNMIAWLAARSDGENYGKLILYKFPKGKQVYGPMQIESAIDQDPEISQKLTLWGQGGSQIIRGNLLIYPIDEGLLYIEPLYILAEQNRFPQLKKVFAAIGDRIVMGDNLDDALNKLFAGQKPVPPKDEVIPQEPDVPGQYTDRTRDELIDELVQKYNKLENRENLSWSEIGDLLDEIGDIVDQLENRE